MKSHLHRGAFALACALAASAAGATTYRLVDLGADTAAYAVNHLGEVAGDSPTGHAAFYTNGAWKDKRDRHHGSRATAIDRAGNLAGIEWDTHHMAYPMYYPRGTKNYGIPLPGGSLFSEGSGANFSPLGMSPDGSKVVGTYNAQQFDDLPRCFAWTPGDAVATDLGIVPGGYEICHANAVNDNGVVVGQLWGTNTGFAAFVWSNGSFRLVGPVGHDHDPVLAAVNAKGHATGNLSDAGAVYWNGTRFSNIAPSGSLEMDGGTAIDDHDNIVGWGANGDTMTILMYTGGQLIDLVPLIDNSTGWDFTAGSPTGLANDGTIVGYAFFDDGSGLEHEHGYILVPDAQ
jgi:hypothetical protein